MDDVKSEAFALKTTYVAAGPDMLLADKDALALPGQQCPRQETQLNETSFCHLSRLLTFQG